MFEFAISQHEKHKPTRRFLVCVLMSLVLHVGGLLTLLRYPELLGPGVGNWLDHVRVSPLARLLEPKSSAEEEKEWRTVTMVGNTSKMVLPSEATLRKYLAGANKNESEKSTTVRVQISKEVLAAISAEKPKPVPPPTLGTEEPRQQPPAAPSADESSASIRAEETSGTSRSAMSLPSGSQGDRLIPVTPKVPSEPASPAASPSSAQTAKRAAEPKATAALTRQETNPFSDQKAVITQEGSGLFDTKGFPLKEYADVIIERIKGNWYIPTTLQNSKGHTTVVFYIDKEGRYTNVRIVRSSGSDTFDLTALNAIINSNPFPPLPSGFPGDQIGAKFVFSYNESQ
jgi:TonB family protein